MTPRPQPRPSTLTTRAQRHHPAIPAEARTAPAQQSGGDDDSNTTQQVNFRADRELVRKVKARLALQGRSMQDLLNEYLRDWLGPDAR